MSTTITIDPITRIEGHSKITIQLDEQGQVSEAHFHVTQFRGFERIVQGRPVHEMPSIMARICGICPVSHLVASAKAVDDILAVDPPPTGADLRRLINLGQMVQSNALSFFHLSSPDLLFGFDADPAVRNIVGVARENPQLANDGIRLRKWGQQIIELLGGKRIHPGGIVPGGVADPLTEEVRDRILSGVPEAIAQVERAIAWYKTDMMKWEEEASTFGNFRSAFMALVDEDGNVDHYGGDLRIVDADGKALVDRTDPRNFNEYIGEAVEPWSYLKSTYYKPMGYPDGIYRVGPLARLNVAEATGTPRADEELQKFRWRVGRVAGSSFHFH
jgi:NAD-reducing hydrogenase large subunit